MAVRIITDSASDFEPEIALDEKIDVVPLAVQFGDTTYWDGKTIAKEQFYQLLQEGSVNPTTSQPTPDAFLQRFEAARDAGDEVVVILLSGALSGTLQSAVIARDLCGYEPIHIVDSRTVSAGLQLLVGHACRLRNEGLSAAAIAGEVESLKGRLRVSAVVDTLEYLRRGGRLTDLQAGLGTVTRLKPVVAVRDGAVAVVTKAFGTGAAIKHLLKGVAEHPIDNRFPLYFLYTSDQSRQDLLRPRLEEASVLPPQCKNCCIGAAIGTHIGTGAVGLAYVEQEV